MPIDFEIQQVSWDEFYPAVLPLFEEEVEETKALSFPLDVDDDLGRTLVQTGASSLFVALVNSTIIGYCIWTHGPNVMVEGKMISQQGPWFVSKDFRQSGIAFALLRKGIEHCKLRGASEVFVHRNTNSDARLDYLFRRLGGREFERVWSIRLEN